MRIIVNHLTRMRHPHVCIAGLDKSREHKRPVLSAGRIARDALRSQGGAFSLGSVVDLGPVEPRPGRPEVEDVVFDPRQVTLRGELDSGRFFDLLSAVAVDSLNAVLGPDLVKKSSSAAAVAVGKGTSSLGVVRLDAGQLEACHPFGEPEIRLHLSDPALGDIAIKVTDLRLWEPDQVTPATKAVASVGKHLDGCLIAVGLTRPFAVSSYPGTWHWLQINNVFPSGDPLWARE